MPYKPKFEVRQTVYKHTGNYGGPGIVRGIASDEGQPLRYLVGHQIQGGFGEFYHVYAEGNLRELDAVVIDPLSAHLAEPDTELLNSLIEAHRQVDSMLAGMVMADRNFMPSKSHLWPEIVKRAALIEKHGGVV